MISDDINFILSHYPAFRDQILVAYDTNDEFKSVCEDFYTLCQILENYRNTTGRNVSVELDYCKLKLELERELLCILEKCQ